jgi:hypothetical protein
MKSRIIEICELGQPQSIIHRENEPITELIKTDSLIEELNEQLLLYNVVGRSEQLCYEDIESTKCLTCGDEACLDAECLQ